MPDQKSRKKLTLSLIALFSSLILAYILLSIFFYSADEPKSQAQPVIRGQVALPAIVVSHKKGTKTVPDFSRITDVRERKTAFFGFLLPAIQAENERITVQRQALQRLHQKVLKGQALSNKESQWLADLSQYYRIETNDKSRLFNSLLRRVDIVPDTLVLIQAANESGWGTSRFAQSARNFFGQWCWTQGCGIVPEQRPVGEQYEVRQFDSMEASVESYIRNLNTHLAYQELRSIRYQLRRNKQQITATPLTAGLMSYSTRGEEYINELQQMIRVNTPIIEAVRAHLTETAESS